MTLSRTRHLAVLLLLFSALFTFSCKKAVAPPPPPPPPPEAPPPPPPAPTITLRANPATIQRGQSTTLNWESRNATSVQIQPEVGMVPLMGNRSVSPTSGVTYTATAMGPGGTATDTARVTVNVPPPPPAPPRPPPPAPTVSITDLFRQNMQEIFFDFDKSDIRADQVARAQADAAFLRQNPNVRFTIEGNCDDRGSEEYNIGLGDRRANALKEYLVSQGIAESRISTVSYGEERPVCRDQNEMCWQMNRRDGFTLNP